jgi:hypothetical protein
MSINNGLPTAYPPREAPALRESSPRLFVFEPGWRVGVKRGSHREFCYMMAPGQDYYHRLLDGELFVYHGDERLCLSCAARRGLISFAPRSLGKPIDPSLADSSELPVFDPDSGDLDF